MIKSTTILAIESSCDETAAAVIRKSGSSFQILSNIVSSQVKIHASYGGIVPEVAARMHIEHMLPIVDKALQEIKKTKNQETKDLIDAVAVTGGPGLITSLLVGVETAKSLSYAWKKPLIKVNHLEGHIFAAQEFDEKKKTFKRGFELPAICLIVSGGHTDLIYMEEYGKYERIGGTRDDAVGEAFDKVAKMMKLGYPGGPAIAEIAKEVSESRFDLPRPMKHSGDFAMSFSGLKTAVLHRLSKLTTVTKKMKAEMAWAFQDAVSEVLTYKTVLAAKDLGVKSIILGGGVSANKVLRERLAFEINNQLDDVKFYQPSLSFTGDNAVMIGLAAHFNFERKNFAETKGFRPDPVWELAGLSNK